jgi:hypothetical protein
VRHWALKRLQPIGRGKHVQRAWQRLSFAKFKTTKRGKKGLTKWYFCNKVE